MKSVKISLILLPIFLFLSCISSVSTKQVRKEGLQNGNEAKGKALIHEAWLAQGFNKLTEHETYEVDLNDTWKGFLGKANTPWPEPSVDLNIKFGIGSFDSQVAYHSGSKKNKKEGLQSWSFYKLDEKAKADFSEEKEKISFILPAFQYFIELTDRLKNAQIITYAGQKEFNGNSYDLVFVTWNKIKRHKQSDQYLLWINSKTKMVDYCEFTIHETVSARYFSGSIGYDNYKVIDGVKIAFSQYLFAGGPKIDQAKHLHSVQMSSFKFDSFDEAILYPNPDLKRMGDSK